ncbi:hypothetical protein [uncultured Psychroserpens sp.]|uniref:hypothetical protein n=1 Tax=uncultured Psychroserpens sp. TaxID=255436 RepID=UPI00262250F8|nr:hypothetical protein [uncultured Psychroserpens sp.]
MNKLTLILLLLLTLTSCNKNSVSKSQIQNKTFNLIFERNADTLIIDFQDSTYHAIEYYRKNNPWKIFNYDHASLLILDNNVFGIKEINKGKFECTEINLGENILKMEERKPRWKQEKLFGTWIEEKYLGTDSTDFPPPPIEDIKSNWPPSYTITKNKIAHDFYNRTESEIQINNTSEFISLELKNPINYGLVDELWQVMFLSDTIMIVNKKIQQSYPSYSQDLIRGITLIKKR